MNHTQEIRAKPGIIKKGTVVFAAIVLAMLATLLAPIVAESDSPFASVASVAQSAFDQVGLGEADAEAYSSCYSVHVTSRTYQSRCTKFVPNGTTHQVHVYCDSNWLFGRDPGWQEGGEAGKRGRSTVTCPWGSSVTRTYTSWSF